MNRETVETVTPDMQAAENQKDTIESLSFRNFNPKLAALRAQNPFLPIIQFPNSSVTFVLAANAAIDIDLPQGTKYIYISGSDEYYISRQGKAQIPVSVTGDSESGSTQNPEGFFLYVEEIRQFSIVAVNADTRVSIGCFQQM
jgi:hypothetical protein